IKTLLICARCLVSYLLAMSSIAFLITLSPIFLSLALFRPTQHFFNDWLKFLISFSLQIVFLFTGLALWITVILQLGGFFANLASMVRPVQQTVLAVNPRFPMNTWGLCQYILQVGPWGPVLQCIDQPMPGGGNCNGQVLAPAANQYCPQPLFPSQLVEHPD